MKKILAIAAIFCFTACEDSKKEASTSTESNTSTSVTPETGNSRAAEIADSTAMLDKQLADTTVTPAP